MIKRIVQMKLIYGKEVEFLKILDRVRPDIRNRPGCLGLEVWQEDIDGQTAIWTISLWQSVDDLEGYRASPLFRKTWSAVRPLFAARAKAWTLTEVEKVS